MQDAFHDFFQQAVKVIKKTGGRYIFVDLQSHEHFVMMTWRDYEKLIIGAVSMGNTKDLTSASLFDKIEREISQWKETLQELRAREVEAQFQQPVSSSEVKTPLTATKTESDVLLEKDKYYFEPLA